MHQLFEDRTEAGRILAKKLTDYHGTDTVLMAIPRGGVPVTIAAAHRLQLDWNVLVVSKLPIPWNPKAGFGAVAADGAVVLNEQMVHGLGMTRSQIESVVNEVKQEVSQRTALFAQEKPAIDVSGRNVIIIDDGLASGYTMLAAIKSLRERSASKIIAAAPVASRSAAAMVNQAADESVFEIVSPTVPFVIADFYLDLPNLTDEDIIPLLRLESTADTS